MGEERAVPVPDWMRAGFDAHCALSVLLLAVGAVCVLFAFLLRRLNPGFYPAVDLAAILLILGSAILLVAWVSTRKLLRARFLTLDIFTCLVLSVGALAALLFWAHIDRFVGCSPGVYQCMRRATSLVSYDGDAYVYDSDAGTLFVSGGTLRIRPGDEDVVSASWSYGIVEVAGSLYSVGSPWDGPCYLCVWDEEGPTWAPRWENLLELREVHSVEGVLAVGELVAVVCEHGTAVVDTTDMSQTWLLAEGPQPDWLVRAREAWTGPPTEAVVADEVWRLEDGAILICDLDGNPKERLVPKNFSIKYLVDALLHPSHRGDPWEHVTPSAD